MIELGSITVPSGVLVISDMRLLGSSHDPKETNADSGRMGVATYEVDGSGIVVLNVPPDRELPVTAVPSDTDERYWSHLMLYVAEGEPDPDAEEIVGRVGADSGHLAFLDEDVLLAWDHEALWERDEAGVRANGHAVFTVGDARVFGCHTTYQDDAGFQARTVRDADGDLLALAIGIYKP